MANGNSAVGQDRSWILLNKIGEGDAGEVFLVESILDQRKAILKRPHASAFSSDIIRQATQIEREGRILKALNGLFGVIRPPQSVKLNVSTPLLLDQSRLGTEFSERFFIIIEKVNGIDLNTFSRVVRQDLSEQILPDQKEFLGAIAQQQTYPRLILLRCLVGILLMFDTIHDYTRLAGSSTFTGIIWNDVKADHIYWDASSNRLTCIDWGNAQFIEADGYTKDHRTTRNEDYAQYLTTMGSFIANNDPELSNLLKWPEQIRPTQTYTETLTTLKQSLLKQLNKELSALDELRKQENEFVHLDQPNPEELVELLNIQNRIAGYGELPDYLAADLFCSRLASRLVAEGRLSEFTQLSSLACRIHRENPQKWQLLGQIASRSDQISNSSNIHLFQSLISAGIVDDWPTVLWDLSLISINSLEPTQLDEIKHQIRQVSLSTGPELLAPLVILKRTAISLQAVVKKLSDKYLSDTFTTVTLPENGERNRSDGQNELDIGELNSYQELVDILRYEVIAKWSEFEPDPPNAGLEYSDIESQIDKIRSYMPSAYQSLDRSLQQPRSQAKIILEAWERKEFDLARRGLRMLLLWDPDRQRVLFADKVIAFTPGWLFRLGQGPQNEQTILDFVTENEFTGRQLRNHVGAASWLDLINKALSELRRGRRVTELLIENPSLSKELPWLETLEPRKYIPSQKPIPINMDREDPGKNQVYTLHGRKEGLVGQGQDLLLAEPLDTWAPEARGSSARAFLGFLRNMDGQTEQVAVKIMRGDQIHYASPLFREEAIILDKLNDVPGVTPLLECGYFKLDTDKQIPSDDRALVARDLTGTLDRFGPDQISEFIAEMESKTYQGWLPYLALYKRDSQENLMWMCDAGYTRGNFIPIEQSLRLAIQICDILQVAHSRSIIYRDHKLLHYYWSELYNGVFMIDWNVARYIPQGVSKNEIEFDLVQLGARAFHHIFTGRVALGALADGPNRVEEIEAAAHSYRVQWTYDDQRLPPDLKELLEQLLTGNYSSALVLRNNLYQVYENLIAMNASEVS